MKTWMKISVSGLAGLIIGVAVSVVAAGFMLRSYLSSTDADGAYRDFVYGFERLSSRDGAPKSQEEIRHGLVNRLSFSTITLGMQFDHIDNPQLQADALRVAKLVEATPSLQGPTTQGTARQAAEVRQCIIEKFLNPPEVAQCARDAYASSVTMLPPKQ